MKFIIIDSKTGRQRSVGANGLTLALVLAALIGVPGAIGYVSFQSGHSQSGLTTGLMQEWRQLLVDQKRSVAAARVEIQQAQEDTGRKVAEMQAHIVRLDAVARRLVAIDGGSLIQEGFDFDAPPALGGPENPIESLSFQPPPYMESLELLSQEIVEREQGLRLLEALFTNNGKSLEKMEFGRPVSSGWLSSRYGYRRDPITGKRAWHQGIDFAGREGADVLAMADGYVRFAGEKAGYGKMIEITHLDGYVTRYGHHKELLVKATDLVQKGDVIGRMGRTGRATGYHVHLEVIKDGKPVNPSSYLHRARR